MAKKGHTPEQIERLYRDSAMVDTIGVPGYLNDRSLALHTVGKTI